MTYRLRSLLAATIAALLIMIFLAISLIRTGEAQSGDYQYLRPGLSHFQRSAILGIGLAYCGRYSSVIASRAASELNELKNNESFIGEKPIDCNTASPSYAVENGHSLVLAAMFKFGFDTPYELSTALNVLKYSIILCTGIILVVVFGTGLTAFMTTGMAWWAYKDELYFLKNRLTLDFHILEPYVWAISLAICAIALERAVRMKSYSKFDWIVLAGATVSMVFLRTYRSSDFYIQEVALMFCAAVVVFVSWQRGQDLARQVGFLITLIALPMLLGVAHLRWVEHRVCQSLGGETERCAAALVNVEHPFLHPIVLGLAVPPSPISKRFGFEWKSDAETLKPAQFINPEVTQLYTPAHEKALLDFYLYIWKNHTVETIQTYFGKFGVLYNLGWIVTFFGLGCIGIGLWFKDHMILLFSLAFMGKAVESAIVYPIYWPQYHQASGILAILALTAIIGKIFPRSTFSEVTLVNTVRI